MDSFLHTDAMDKLKKLLGFSDDSTDRDIQAEFAMDSAEEFVKNYCNIDEIPAGLTNTVIKMAADIFRNEGYGSGQMPQIIKSVSIGDTKTDFGSAQAAGYGESLLKDYRKQLNRYRRLKC